jgi:DNA-binding transcriptional ArsR family regulator
MAKFKIGFDVDAETLFDMMAKFLPIDNLTVEELTPPPRPDPAIRFDKRFDLPKGISKQHTLPSTKRKKYARNKPSIPMDLTKGINRIILDLLEHGPHYAVEFKKPMANAGYSPNSVGSRLQSLEEKGIIKRTGDGKWKLLSHSLPPIGMSEVGRE